MKHTKIAGILLVAFTAVACVGLYCIATKSSKAMLNAQIETRMQSLILGVQNEITAYNYSNFSTIHLVSTLPIIKDPNVSIKTKGEQLFGVKDADPSLVGLNITDLQGNSYLVEGPLYNFAERPYFKNALKGEETIFGPINNKVSNVPTIFYGAPNYDKDGNLINTFFLATKGDALSKICELNTIGNKMHVSVVRRTTGVVIGDTDPKTILTNNIFDDAADSDVPALHAISEKISRGEAGFEFVKLPDGRTKINAYAPIKDAADWTVLITAWYDDLTSPLKAQKRLLCLFSACMIALSAAAACIIAFRKPKSCS